MFETIDEEHFSHLKPEQQKYEIEIENIESLFEINQNNPKSLYTKKVKTPNLGAKHNFCFHSQNHISIECSQQCTDQCSFSIQ